MNRFDLRALLLHAVSIFVLILIGLIIFSPAVFQNKSLTQSDNVQAIGMQAELREYKKVTGEHLLWTNSAFGGMPTYQLSPNSKANHISQFSLSFRLWHGISSSHIMFILLLIGMYVSLCLLNIDFRIGLLSAILFGLMTHNIHLLEAGHSTKVHALVYVGPVIASVVILFSGRILTGAILTGFFLSLNVYSNHLQITYYLLMIIGCISLFYFIDAIRKKELKSFVVQAGILAVISVIAFATSASNFIPTKEYSEESTRGGKGLSFDYAMNWSYGKLETFNLLIPNITGGASTEKLTTNSATYKAMTKNGLSAQAEGFTRRAPTYWGSQDFVSGPNYFGISVFFLFLIGAFLFKGPLKKAILLISGFLILLSWGENFLPFNNWTFDYIPMYSKFRAVSMAQAPLQVLVIILAGFGLSNFFSTAVAVDEKKKALKNASLVLFPLLILIGLFGMATFDYSGNVDAQLKQSPAWLLEAIKADRASMFLSDLFRTILFASSIGAILFFTLYRNMKPLVSLALIGVISFMDLYLVTSRYLTDESFSEQTVNTKPALTKVDQIIYQTEATNPQTPFNGLPHYRVADFSSSRGGFANARASYFHKTVNGYHAAKLNSIQKVIETYLNNPNTSMHILGMLNVKYLIQDLNGQPIYNSQFCGNAWLPSSIKAVSAKDAALSALQSLSPKDQAIVISNENPELSNWQPGIDSNASIVLTSYHPEELIYSFNSTKEQFAVFSEVFYKSGWEAYIDNKKVPSGIVRTNYLIRGLKVPAGKHEIKFSFEPASITTANSISSISSIIIILSFIGALVYSLVKGKGITIVESIQTSTLKVSETKKVKRRSNKKK